MQNQPNKTTYFLIPIILIFLLNFCGIAYPEPGKELYIVKTDYCDIYYPDDGSLSGFFWRISGKKFDSLESIRNEGFRIDRLVERVLSVLDMYPVRFHVNVRLFPKYEKGKIALYDSSNNTITVYADKITDGIFAHELSHAVMCRYFKSPPPHKMQEILSQYVDKHLWEEY